MVIKGSCTVIIQYTSYKSSLDWFYNSITTNQIFGFEQSKSSDKIKNQKLGQKFGHAGTSDRQVLLLFV